MTADSRRFEPPTVESAAAAFDSAVRGVRRRLSLPVGNAQWEVRIVAPRPKSQDVCLRLTNGSASAWVRCAEWGALPPVAELSAGAFASLPPEIQAIVADAAFAPALAAVANVTGAPWQMAQIDQWPTASRRIVGFELRDPAGAMRRGEVAFDAAAADDFVKLIRSAPTQPWRDLQDLPLAASVLLGESQIAAADLETLNVGDVAIVERPSKLPAEGASVGSSAVLQIGGALAFEVERTDNGLTLTAPTRMPTASNAQTVRFEALGETMSLAAAQGLQPGAVVPLAKDQDVRLTVAGKTVAFGDEVVCAGQLAVRIRGFGEPGKN